MNNCTFLKVKQNGGDFKYINPDRIRSFDAYSEDLTHIIFSEEDYLIIEMPVEEFVQLLTQAHYNVKDFQRK